MKKSKEKKTTSNKKMAITFENVISCIPGSVYWKDTKGVYLGCNDGIVKLLGISKEDVIGKTDYELAELLNFPKETADTFRKVDMEVITSGIPQFNIEEAAFPDKQGNIVQQLTSKVPLRNKDGVVVGVLGNSIDIAERKKIERCLKKEKIIAEKILQDTETTLENIIASIPGSIYWKNREGVYLGCNDTVIKSFGISKEEFLGKTDYFLANKVGWPKEKADAVRKIDVQVMESGTPQLNHEEAPFIDNNGNIIYQLTNKVPLRNKDGTVIGIIGNSIDISERKRIEVALKEAKEAAEIASQSKSTFIANMSHDIRTPLAGIIGMASLLESEASTPEEKEYAHNILVSGERLNDLLNSILELVSSNNIDDTCINKNKFNLRQLLQDIYDIYFLNAKAKKLNLKIEIDENVPSLVISDRLKIYRVLFNIVGNAIKFTPAGEVIIKVKYLGSIDQQVRLEFSVSDTGIGISNEFQGKVFERFARETPSYKGTYQGYGIGLHMAQNYVGVLGSKIHLISQQGKGSTFYFELEIEMDKTQNTQSGASVQLVMPASPTALLVEDDKIASMVVEMMLIKLKFSVITAMNGEDALEIAKKEHYHFILTDLGLPKMSGEEFVQHFREWEKSIGRNPVPVIALTGHGDSSVAETCLKIGMNRILIKPLNFEMLKNILEEISL
ncbi:MAG: arcB 2 [Gammaproteobacteria bacterium]|jgi:PAS domain S-box-containing protein|nr:arcB 2 [Gammaproteobacteria bacterium]